MSTRRRESVSSYPRSIVNERGETLVSDTLSFKSSRETISSSNTHWRGVSNCVHDATWVHRLDGSHLYYGDSSGTTRWQKSSPVAFGVGTLFGNLEFSNYDLNSLNTEAFRTMRPGMESGFSGTNWLIELVELKTMFKLWDSAQGLLKNLSSGVLNYNYGWKLFIRDAVTIYERLKSFSERLDSLLKNQGAPQKAHFRKVLATTRASEDLPFTLWGNDRVKYEYTYITPLTYTATMWYRYYLPDIAYAELRARALADHFGLKLNASVIWEAIPLSFVVDWFVGVGDFLSKNFNSNWLEPSIEILDFCYSLKHEITSTVSCRRNVGNPANSVWALSHTCRRKIYRRVRCIPNVYGWASLDTNDKSWNATRYLIASSLLYQRTH